jgi:hypothetical protein
VSPLRTAAAPRGPLHRIGRLPDPLAWPPWEAVGGGRFDDPARRVRVLYAASRRRGAFVESLAPFRPALALLARLRDVAGADEPVPEARVPADWYRRRAVGRLRLAPGQRWLDLRSPATREALRRALAAELLRLGMADLDLSGVVGPSRALTQAIAGWAHEQGYAGLAYASRIDQRQTCWAVFEGARFEPAGLPAPITPDDPDLRAVARLFGLEL